MIGLETLTKKLKVITRRHLSAEEMANAKPGDYHPKIATGVVSNPENYRDNIFKVFSGESFRYQRYQQKFEAESTPIAFAGENARICGFYPIKTIENIYDANGHLILRNVANGRLPSESTRTKKYNPHGRWFGRKAVHLGKE